MSRDLDTDFEFEESFSNRPQQSRGGINPSMAQSGGVRPQGGNSRPQGNGVRPQGNNVRPQGNPGRPQGNPGRPQGNGPMRPQGQGAPMRGPQGGPMNGGMNGMGGMRPAPKQKKSSIGPIIILGVEIVVFIALIVLFFVLKAKIENPSGSSESNETTQESQSNGVNVDSEEFKLECTKVQLANDANGAPTALVYFTFINKTSTPLSMQEVFPPSLTQNGMECATGVTLTEEPVELYNKDVQVADGNPIECCFAFSLSDLTSTLTLTIKDNYKTFTNIGSTEIPLS